jgi:hypothetical protein
MYPISQTFAEYLKRHDREFLVKADIAGTEYGNNVIVDFTIENSLTLSDEFEIGTTILSKLTIKLRTPDAVPANARITPYLALSLSGMTWLDADMPWDDAIFPWAGGATEWMPLGEFYVDGREKVNDTWVYTCYDKLVWADVPYISSLTYPAPQQAVWNEICVGLGYSYDASVVIDPNYMIQAGLAGYSKRQVLGYIASANSASVFVGKDGKVKFKRFDVADTPVFEYRPSDYVRALQTNPIKQYTRIVVTYNTEDELTYEAGTGDEAHTLYIENPFATQAITDDLLTTLNGFAYLPINMDSRGFPQLEHGDIIGFGLDESLSWLDADMAWGDAVLPWNGIVGYQSIMLHTVVSFKGGLKMTVEAPSISEQQSEFAVDGTLTTQIKNTVKQGRSYYGMTITRTEGLTIEREDHASKAIFNSDELTFYKGSEKALWFDVPNEIYKFTGVIEASSFVGGNIAIGNGDNIFKADVTGIWLGNESYGSAPFRVNMAGQATLTDATVTGTINATSGVFSGDIVVTGSFIGGTITGALIRTAATGTRIELSNVGAFLTAYLDSNNYISIDPAYPFGLPALYFTAGGTRNGAIYSLTGGGLHLDALQSLYLSTVTSGDITLAPASGYQVRFPSGFGSIDGAGQNLGAVLASKANGSGLSGTVYVAATSGGPTTKAITFNDGVRIS